MRQEHVPSSHVGGAPIGSATAITIGNPGLCVCVGGGGFMPGGPPLDPPMTTGFKLGVKKTSLVF